MSEQSEKLEWLSTPAYSPDMVISSATWWGEYEIPVGRGGRIRVGPTEIIFQHLDCEWRIARERAASTPDGRVGRDDEVSVDVPCDVDDLMTHDDLIRFGTASGSSLLVIAPALADRAVVARPEKPFSVAPEDAVVVYVSSPLWAQLRLGPGDALLHELPIVRPSDTWFGPSPREGELCYAGRSFMRLRVEQLEPSAVRARTPVRIENHTESALVVERIKLPVRYLALHRAKDGGLWTDAIRLDNRDGSEPVPLEFGSWGLVPEDAAPLAPPRNPDRGSLVERTLQLLSRHVG